MKKACLSGMVFFCMCMYAYAQKIQYSRQTVKKLYTDDVQLVANIGGKHHLLRFNIDKKPIVYIYDAQLQLKGEETIDLTLRNNIATRILTFREHYFLYMHTGGVNSHALYRIDGDGQITSLSAAFQKIIDTTFNKSKATLQFINQDERLLVVAHTYYDAIKKIGSTVAELDKEMNLVRVQKVFFNFNMDEDGLHQTMLAGNSLLALKTSKHKEKGDNTLSVIKANLLTGESIFYSLSSGSHVYTNCSLNLQPKDSSILVHAMISTPASGRIQGTGFISCLNSALQEIVPATVLRPTVLNGATANYFLLQGYSFWLNLSNNFLQRLRRQETTTLENLDDPQTYSTERRPSVSSRYTLDNNLHNRIRFSVLNDQLKTVKDSVISTKRYEYGLQPSPFSQVIINNKACLFLIQNFTGSSRGLFMISGESTGHRLVTTEISVYDKYEYLLDQLKAVNNNSVILPYLHKNEAGLVKISFD